MGPFINYCGNIYAFIDGEWIDITEIKDACIRLAEEEDEEIPDEDIPFCDRSCCDCPEIVDEDEFEDDCEEPLFWGVPDIRRIVFNDPATIVFWDDGTKTVVKTCEGDKFERYMGFAAACMKKMFGSTSRAKAIMNECDQDLMKWDEIATSPKCSKPEPKEKQPKQKTVSLDQLIDAFASAVQRIATGKEEQEEKKDGTPAE